MSTDDEDKVNAQMKNYEHKIEDLMNEVGTLKSEVWNKLIRNLPTYKLHYNIFRPHVVEQF